jgi:hypothetical protein
MDGGVVSPNDSVIIVAKIPSKPQDVAEVASHGTDVRDMKYGTPLDELCRI